MNANPNKKKGAELVGANDAKIKLVGKDASTKVQLDNQTMNTVSRGFMNFAAGAGAVPPPDRVFLNLENIRSNVDGPVIDVYVNLPQGANPAEHPENRAGTVALFGVENASQPDQPHGGTGVTVSLEITKIFDALHLSGNLNISNLDVRLVPRTPLADEHNVTVDRISVYRQPA